MAILTRSRLQEQRVESKKGTETPRYILSTARKMASSAPISLFRKQSRDRAETIPVSDRFRRQEMKEEGEQGEGQVEKEKENQLRRWFKHVPSQEVMLQQHSTKDSQDGRSEQVKGSTKPIVHVLRMPEEDDLVTSELDLDLESEDYQNKQEKKIQPGQAARGIMKRQTEQATRQESSDMEELLSGEESTDGDESISEDGEAQPSDAHSLIRPVKKRKHTKSGEKRKSRGISERNWLAAADILQDHEQEAAIINAAQYHPSQRRPRIPWTDGEVVNLRDGVARFGYAWADILSHTEYSFHPSRRHVDLKDKWRNLCNYRSYSSRPLRRYIVLDAMHNPILASNGRPYRFRNRWPREAALKAAARAELYGEGQEHTWIYLREIDSDAVKETTTPIVHVYEGTRRQVLAPNALKFEGYRYVWVADVHKVREEQYVSREQAYRLEREARLAGKFKVEGGVI